MLGMAPRPRMPVGSEGESRNPGILKMFHNPGGHCYSWGGHIQVVCSFSGVTNQNPMDPCNYGIYTYIYHKNQPNVGKYTIHGSYGKFLLAKTLVAFFHGRPKRPKS